MLYRKLRGFTLVELLVSVSIIFILIALVMPVFASARRRGYQTVCTSNLRQTYLAMSLYFGDNDDGNVPFLGLDLLTPYSRSKEIFACPMDHYVKRQPGLGFPVYVGYSWGNANPNQRHIDYRISYAFIGDYDPDAHFWQQAKEKSPIGVLACQWHGDLIKASRWPITVMNPPLGGKILRIVFDGHLYQVKDRKYKAPFSVPDMFYLPYKIVPGGSLE